MVQELKFQGLLARFHKSEHNPSKVSFWAGLKLDIKISHHGSGKWKWCLRDFIIILLLNCSDLFPVFFSLSHANLASVPTSSHTPELTNTFGVFLWNNCRHWEKGANATKREQEENSFCFQITLGNSRVFSLADDHIVCKANTGISTEKSSLRPPSLFFSVTSWGSFRNAFRAVRARSWGQLI